MARLAASGSKRRAFTDDDVVSVDEATDEESMSPVTPPSDSRKKPRLTDEASYGSFISTPDGNIEHREMNEQSDEDNDELDYRLADDEEALRHMNESRERQAVPNNKAAEDAIIEEVTCTNFMCHAYLTIKPGPFINFIIGHNGSGKSAVLTALVLCLGGKASATNRGGSLKSFIKEGREICNLVVKIKNTGPAAYKPEIFGPSVIVERFFSRTNSSGYKIKSASNKTVSIKREELDTILDYFALQLDNPINVLSQDMARQFLNSSSPADKYRFFQKGTQLERLDADYRQTSEVLDQLIVYQKEITNQVEEVKTEWERAKKNKERISGQRRIQNKIDEVIAQMCWASVAQEEKVVAEYDDNIAQVEREMEEHAREAETAKQEIATVQNRITEATAKYEEMTRNERQPVEEKKVELTVNLKKQQDEARTMMAQEREIHEGYTNAQNDVKSISGQIESETRKLQQMSGDRPNELRQELKTIGKTLEEIEQQQSFLREQTRLLEEKQGQAKFELEKKRGIADERKARVAERQNRIKDLEKGGGPDEDPALQRVLGDIRRERGFSAPLIGPLWKHVFLLEQEWSSILESYFGPTLNAFCVRTKQDQDILLRILKRHKLAPTPRIFVTKDSQRFDTLAKQPDANLNIKTWMKVLKIDNDVVFNTLVMFHGIEQTVLIRDRAAARSFADARHRNVAQVFTFHEDQQKHRGKGFRFAPGSAKPIHAWRGRSRMRADVQARLSHERGNLEAEQAELEAAENDVKSAHKCLVETKRDADQNDREITKVQRHNQNQRKKKERLEDELDAMSTETSDLTGLEEALDKARQDLLMAQNAQKEAKKERNRIDQSKKALEEEMKEVQRDLVRIDDKLQRILGQQQALTKDFSDATLGKAEAEARIRRKENDKETIKEERMIRQEILDSYIASATEMSPRIPIPRGETTESLKKKHDKLEEDLRRAQEQMGGSEEELEAAEIAARKVYEEKQIKHAGHENLIKHLTTTLDVRLDRWAKFTALISGAANDSFTQFLSQRQFRGKLKFNHSLKTLDLQVEPDISKKSAAGRQTKTLSGGEKSFSTICLLLALWDAMGSRIRCLDEFDVFMDNVNRDVSMRMMIEAARHTLGRQFVFITPQSMGNVPFGPDIKIHKMIDPERGQTTLVV